jgi:hypothetical protein
LNSSSVRLSGSIERKSRTAGLSSPIVTTTDVDRAENRTTVPTTWSTLPSGVSDEAGGGDGAIAGGAGVSVLAGSVGGATVGATVGGELVGTPTVAIGVGGAAADGGADVSVGAQAAMKTAVAISMSM